MNSLNRVHLRTTPVFVKNESELAMTGERSRNVRHITFAMVNRVLWMAMGISFSAVSTILLMLPLARAEDGALPMLWIAGGTTAIGGFLLGRFLAGYLERALVSAEPDSSYRCIGVAMWHGALAGMLLGAFVMAALFSQSMIFGLIFPEVGFGTMIINSLIIGASYGVMLGLMTGLITGAAAAYQTSRGEDLTAGLPAEKEKKGRRKKGRKK